LIPFERKVLEKWFWRECDRRGIPRDLVDFPSLIDMRLSYWENKRRLEEILKVVPSEEDLMRAYPSDFPLVEPKPGSEFDGTQLRDEDVPIPLYVRMDRAADRMEGLMNESEGDVALIFREMRDHYLHLSKYLKLLYELDKKRGWF